MISLEWEVSRPLSVINHALFRFYLFSIWEFYICILSICSNASSIPFNWISPLCLPSTFFLQIPYVLLLKLKYHYTIFPFSFSSPKHFYAPLSFQILATFKKSYKVVCFHMTFEVFSVPCSCSITSPVPCPIMSQITIPFSTFWVLLPILWSPLKIFVIYAITNLNSFI